MDMCKTVVDTNPHWQKKTNLQTSKKLNKHSGQTSRILGVRTKVPLTVYSEPLDTATNYVTYANV